MQALIAADFLDLIFKTLAGAPVDWPKAAEEAGIESRLIGSQGEFMPLHQLLKILAIAKDQIEDEYLVLRYYDRSVSSFFMNLPGAMLSMSANLNELYSLFRRYSSLNNGNNFDVRIEESRGFCIVTIDVMSRDPGYLQFMDLLLLFIDCGIETLSGRGFKVEHMELNHRYRDEDVLYRHFGRIRSHTGFPYLKIYADQEIFGRKFHRRDHRMFELVRQRVEASLELRPSNDSMEYRVVSLIEEHLAETELSSDKLAEMLGMGRATFFRKMRENSLSFQELLQRVRREKAVRYLLESDMECWEVGLMVGFVSEVNFNRFFKKAVGMTPRKYRAYHKS